MTVRTLLICWSLLNVTFVLIAKPITITEPKTAPVAKQEEPLTKSEKDHWSRLAQPVAPHELRKRS